MVGLQPANEAGLGASPARAGMIASPRQWRGLLLGACGGAMLMFSVVLFVPMWTSAAAAVPINLAAEATTCSFDICESAGCDKALNPYYCEGTGGCAAVPWGGDCAGPSCSLDDCASVRPDGGAATCEGVACPTARCADGAQQLCGDDQPYQCLTGSAGLGCSDDPYGWAAVVDTTCSACCDARSCSRASGSGATVDLAVVGADKDARGCIPSAGYTWCESLGECTRAWDTGCPDS